METLVSICIPAYNNEKYIKNTLLSIINQTYENLEILVVDDCSQDETVSIVEKIGKKDHRVVLYQNDKNLGMVGNWNKCLSLAKGDYIKLICGDDQIDKRAIEKEALAMKCHPTVNLVESDTRLIDINGKKTGVFRRFPKSGIVNGKRVAKISLMINNFFGAPVNNLIRKSALKKVSGFDTAFNYILDFDLWTRIACTGDIYIMHEVLNSFCIRNDSNTGNLINQKQDVYVNEHKKLLEKHAALKVLNINSFEIHLSILIRRLRNVLIKIYLKIFAK